MPAVQSQERAAGLLDSVGRFIGFLMFAGPAMLIVAALVLLPLYKHYADQQYELACRETQVQEAKADLERGQRLIRDLPDDEVLNLRLIISQTSLTPANETVVYNPSSPSKPPMMITPVKLPPPPPPSVTKSFYVLGMRVDPIAMANRMENPTTKRGLILVAIGSFMAALFLFSPPAPRRKD